MKIGLIGAGHIGGTLARRLAALGHEVSIANSRGPETLEDFAREMGAKTASVQEAVKNRELVIVTIPMKNIPKLPHGLFSSVPEHVPVIDTCNYYPQQRDGRIDPIENGMTESRWVAEQLGHPVIKVFNNIYAKHLGELGRSEITADRIALPVAGDSEPSKVMVMDLVNQLGFDAVDAGTIDESWRQQPGTPVYATDLNAEGVRRALAEATRERKPEWKATQKKPDAA
jgi:hypothetical protein